jgi:hypothetical protein
MNDAQKILDSLLQGGAAQPPVPRSSRYFGISALSFTTADGRAVSYLDRRFVPQPSSLSVVGDRAVVQGDRLDLLAAELFGDPEQYFRLCDANNALRPNELVETLGRRLLVTLPGGVAAGVLPPNLLLPSGGRKG